MIIKDCVTVLYIDSNILLIIILECSLSTYKNISSKTVCGVTPAAASYILHLLRLLIVSFSLVLGLILCGFKNLVYPNCTVFIKSTLVYSNVLCLHVHSPLTE